MWLKTLVWMGCQGQQNNAKMPHMSQDRNQEGEMSWSIDISTDQDIHEADIEAIVSEMPTLDD